MVSEPIKAALQGSPLRLIQTSPMVLSAALAPERILIFFGRESPWKIIERLSRTYQNMDWEHVLNAVRAPTVDLLSPTVQVLHGCLPGLSETKAALAVSRLGTPSLPESQTLIHAVLMLVSPHKDRFSERTFLRKAFELFAAHKDLDIQLSQLHSADAVLNAIRAAEFR